MITRKSILGVIPARSGSKGLTGKNKRVFLGKPLIAWTIEEAKKSKYIDRLIVSTDDNEIINIAQGLNCEVPYKRPDDLAQDSTAGIDVALHAIEQCPGFDIVVYLQPTSPMRTVSDIDKCIENLIKEKNPTSSVSVCKPEKSPYLMYIIDNGDKLRPLFPKESKISNRQDYPTVYCINGAIYAAHTNWLKEKNSFIGNDTVPHIMPRIRSIDIDDELDFFIAENCAKKFRVKK